MRTNNLKAFIYRGEAYIRCIPAKSLFHSTLVHEAVNRGSVFAMRVSDQQLTIIPGTADVQHFEAAVQTPDTEFKLQIQERLGKHVL